MNKSKLAVLIPAHNEGKVIGSTLAAMLKVVKSKDIFVVNDGSTDNTKEVAKQYVSKVLTIKVNLGKAQAMNLAVKKYKLSQLYEYILPMDADTKINQNFIEQTLPILEADQKGKIACVVGKVIGKGHNWITLYRLWEYEVAQTIHKAAQAVENAIIVCPGCATVYRAKIFKKIIIPTGTLTEDMDLTFLIHRKKLGKIAYTDKAVVVTQDPESLKDFLKQIDRWYTGFWQCVVKHHIPWGGQTLDAELAMLMLEGLFNGLLMLVIIFLIPYTLFINPQVLIIPLVVDLLFFLLPTMLLVLKRHKAIKIFFYLPNFYFLRILGSLIFLKSFMKVVLGVDLTMDWNKASRYITN